jgi:citrate lyase gamma subunit
VFYQPVIDLAALALLTPADGEFFELQDSTGAETDPNITSVPMGLVGAAGLTFRLRYNDPPGEYEFLGYFANDSETRYIKTVDIGVTVEPYDASILKSADIGVTVQGYDAGTLKSSDIGVTVQGYDAGTLKSGDIGVTVQGYDADTAKYDDTTANFTGTLQNGGSNVVVDTDIGTNVQAYDADTAKTDVAQTFTAAQRGAYVTLTDAATIDVDLSLGNQFQVTLAGNRTLDEPTNIVAGQSGVIRVIQDNTGSRTLAYDAIYKFPGGTAPTLTTTADAVDLLAYHVESATRIAVRFIGDVK